jgi:DUF177 domain-containing protein
MEIKVSEIPPEGQGIELVEDPEGIGPLGPDIEVTGPVKATFSLKKTGPTVYMSGNMETAIGLECARCGRRYESKVSSEFVLDMNPIESVQADEEKELQAADLEVEFYEDDKIDLTDFLREQILLQAPMKPLCSEDCKGLCQYCGQDLNVKDCGCQAPTGHPGLAGLKDILKDKK